MTTMASGIYKISSITHPDRVYIGSAKDLIIRLRTHLSQFRKGKHINYLLLGHIKKYGIEDLKFEIIEECSIDSLLIREQYFIDSLKPSFNICKKAGNTLGRKWTESARNKRNIKPFIQREKQKEQVNFFKLIAEPILSRQRIGYNKNHYECLICGDIHFQTERYIAKIKCKCQIVFKLGKPKRPKPITIKNGYNVKRKDNTSGYPGITWDRSVNKWRARIKHKGNLLDAGRFQTKEAAHYARQQKLLSMNVPIRPWHS
ncbi:MAG TPA: GIY-YIG nuclease family protein [Cyclobacteriaceae bacterium]|jgi:group I intron endonuclease|nr:GIY-YIG nuclease family protein [Cyclobacteriaceae bacterium]